jgi:hypothetical protein
MRERLRVFLIMICVLFSTHSIGVKAEDARNSRARRVCPAVESGDAVKTLEVGNDWTKEKEKALQTLLECHDAKCAREKTFLDIATGRDRKKVYYDFEDLGIGVFYDDRQVLDIERKRGVRSDASGEKPK